MDLTPGPGYGDHKPITHPSSPKHVWCDGCNRRWPCEVVRAYRAGREDAAKEVPERVAVAAERLRRDIREAIDVCYGELGGEADTPEDVAGVERAIAHDMATVLDWIARGQHPRTPGEDVTP